MRRISLVTSIFTIAVFVVAAVTIGLLYRTSLSQETARLEEVAHSQARMIEAIARHEAKYSPLEPAESARGDALASTLAQVRDANERFTGFGHTGEFSLARREGDSIVYLLTQRHPGSTRTMAIPFNGTKGEPMRRALSGLSGTVVGPDYRGVTVLAAYEPVSEFGLGIVAKIDLAEIRAPFVRAGLIGLVLAFVTVLLGSLLFYRITNPVLVQLRESTESLRRTDSLLEAVTTGTEVIVAAVDTDFRYVFFNEAYREEIERLGGKGLQVGASMRDVFAHMPELRQAAIENWGRTLKGDVRGTYRMEFGDPARYRRTYNVRQTLIRDAQGEIVAAGEVASNITEQVRAEETLSRSEATLRGILDATRESIWLFSIKGTVLQANAIALKRFGKTGPGVVGKSFEEILPPELARLRRTHLLAVVESARPVEFEDERAGMQFRHSFYPVLDAGGRVTAVVSFSRDITESRRAEQALRVSEERFRAVAFNTPDHILVQDRELRYELVVNPQLGLNEQDMLGKTDYDFLSESGADRLTAMKRQVMQTGQPLHVEMPLTSAKGEPELFDGTYVPRLDPQGRSNGVIGYFRNVTERKRAEEALRDSRAKLQAAMASMNEAVFIADAQGRFTDYSNEFVRYHRFRGDEECSKQIAECPRYLEAFLSDGTPAPPEMWAMPRALRGEAATDVEYMLRRKDTGETWWGSYSFGPIRSKDNEIVGAVVAAREITDRKRAEARLREQAAMLASVNDAIVGYDPDYHVTFWNRSAELMYGYTAAEALGRASTDLFHPVYVGATCEQLAERIAADGHIEAESIRTTRDGRQLSVEAHVIALRDEQGTITGYVSVDRDITERKLNEARVTRLAALYAVLSRVNETIVRTHDAGRLYSEVCRIVSEEGGFPLAWIGLVDGRRVVPVASGGTARDYLKEIRVETDGELGKGPTGVSIREDRAVVNDDFDSNPITAPWREPARRYGFRASASFPIHQEGKVIGTFTLYASEPGVFDEEQVQLFRALSADVSYALDAIDQERLHAEAEEALREAKETLEVRVKERTAELTAEIEERKRAEERLTAASQYARNLLESSLDPLVTISADGKITDVNEATIKVTGLPRGQLIGTDFSEYFTEPERARNGYRQVFARGLVTDYPLTIRHRDGHLTDVLYNASVYKDSRGTILGVFAAARDVTARKQAEQELQKAHDTLEVKVAERTSELKRSNEELEQFAYVASHDLQQPLRMVASYVELLGQRYKGRLDDKADKYIAYASGGAIRMHQLVNDLLAFSRVGAKAAPFASVNLNRVVAQARENLTVAIEQSSAVVEAGPLPGVSGDETQLVQLFQNLLDNAIKFRGSTHPRVLVSCCDAGTEWEFAVQDNGIGIDPKHAERIFGVFKRLHTEQEYPGTGIGLAICKKIIERHGGRIRVEPAEGGGSVFLFTLPRQPAASSDKPAGATT